MSKKTIIVLAIAALVVIGLALFLGQHRSFGTASAVGSSPIPTTISGGSVPSVVSAFEATESLISDGSAYLLSQLKLGSTVTGVTANILPVTGSCATATSTIFSVANPFGATSTVFFGSISGTNSAQTSDIVVGTSSLSTVTATSSSSKIFGLAAIASSAQFYSVMGLGVAQGSGGGTYNPPQTAVYAGTNGTTTGIVLGPNDRITGYATSTATTGGFGVTSCTYKFLIMN